MGRPFGDLTPRTDFARRLQQVMGPGNMSAIAEEFGLHRLAWRAIYVGEREPEVSTLRKIVDKTGCNGHWLVTGSGAPYPLGATSRATSAAPVTVPLAGRAAARSSDMGDLVFDHQGDPMVIPPTTAYVEVSGESMAPIARPGQSVLIDTSGRTPSPGELVVVELNDGRTYFKRYYPENGTVQLTSLNPVQPEPTIVIPATSIRRIHVVRGVWFG